MFKKLLVLEVFFVCILSVSVIYAGQDTIPQKVKDDVTKLFQTRDKAVNDKDQQLYLQTQIGHIKGGSVSGYMKMERMKTDVLSIVPQQDDPELACIAFVRERYFKNKQESRRGYLIYYLVNTNKGWKATKIVY